MSESHQRSDVTAQPDRERLNPDVVPPPTQIERDVVSNPAGLIRIGTMVQALRDEVRDISLDEPGRRRLTEIHRRSVDAIMEALSGDLREELAEFVLPLGEGVPSQGELLIAQAQLAGWLDGLFRGIQAAVFTQQMASQRQLEELRRGRPAITPGSEGQYL
jgi:hypothetical protein